MGKDDATPTSNDDAQKGNNPAEDQDTQAQAEITSEATHRMDVKAKIESEGSLFSARTTESQGGEESEE